MTPRNPKTDAWERADTLKVEQCSLCGQEAAWASASGERPVKPPILDPRPYACQKSRADWWWYCATEDELHIRFKKQPPPLQYRRTHDL